ncbi:MAG TPA: hypothetical protein VH253_00615 [Phycisphaerae bacterium]|nr:hypothetical protein [Phycisphaerae bacterium]
MPHPLPRLSARLSLLAALLATASTQAQTTAPASAPAADTPPAHAQPTASQPATQSAALPGPDGWLTLFRASDPALWNSDAGDPAAADGFALPISDAPENLRYLRLKRMDTGDAVIVQLTRDDLASKVLPGRCFVWAGNVRHAGPAGLGYLGLAELAYPARDTGDFYVFQNARGDAGYGGYGFGKAVGSDDQRYFWNNAPIAKTPFEISVTSAELSNDQRKTLLIPGKLEVFSAQWGPVGNHVDVVKKLIPHVQGDGDLEMPITPANLGKPPAGPAPELAVAYALNGERKSLELPQGRNLWLVAPAILGAPPLPPPSDAPPPPTAPPETDPNGWTVLFRGDNPDLWNTNTGNPDMITGFAASTDKAPANVLYLRLRRLDNGQYVIIPITHDALADGGPINTTLVWAPGKQTWRGVHLLGIAQEADPADKPGDLFVYRDALIDGGLRGWGFAKAVDDDFQPAYSWNGQSIPRTTFEIAVKAKPLVPAERAAMLMPGKLLITNAQWGLPGHTLDISRKLQNLVTNGAIDLPLVAGDLLGPAIPQKTRELSLVYEANGVHGARKLAEGDSLVLAAPVVTESLDAARNTYPTMEEITASMQARDYPATLKSITRVLTLNGDAARAYDRYTLFLDRAECLLQTRDRAGALSAAQLAAREAKDPQTGAEALALAEILRHSPNGNYLPPHARPPGLPITAPADRKAAYDALWKQQQETLDSSIADATAAATLPPILETADTIPLTRAAEIMSTGKSTATSQAAKSLATRAAALITDQLSKDSQHTEDLFNAAFSAHAINPDQLRDLRSILTTCDQITPALEKLAKSLAPNTAPLQPVTESLNKLTARVKEVATRRY